MSEFKKGDYIEVVKTEKQDKEVGLSIGMRGYVLNDNPLEVNFINDYLDFDKCKQLRVKYNKELYCWRMLKDQIILVEYPLTIQDILKEENKGKIFIDNKGREIIITDENLNNISITVNANTLKEILSLKFKEYKDETDWSKVTVDTPIWVKYRINDKWLPGHFAKYENGKVYAWMYGATSFTSNNKDSLTIICKYVKLAEENNKKKR